MKSKKKTLVLGLASLCGIASLASCSPTTYSYNYTMNTSLSTNPKTWNVHNWETSDESYVSGFTEMGLYDCILNGTKNGYIFVNEMAAAEPVAIAPKDVTTEEKVNVYGQSESTTVNLMDNQVWDIKLNENAKWEDGTPITAQDYIDSMELLLDPHYANYRADSFYNGNLQLQNAENYYKQGRQNKEAFYNYRQSGSDKPSISNFNGYYYLDVIGDNPFAASIFSGDTSGISLYSAMNQLASEKGVTNEWYRIYYAYCYWALFSLNHDNSTDKEDWNKSLTKTSGELVGDPTSVTSTMLENLTSSEKYLDTKVFEDGFKKADGSGTTKIKTIKAYGEGKSWTSDNVQDYTLDMFKEDMKAVAASINSSVASAVGTANAWALPLMIDVMSAKDGTYDFKQVGIRKKDDYTIRLLLNKSITKLNLYFSLTGNWIVKTDLYKKLTQTTSSGTKNTTYASGSVNNYKSYGPYKLVEYVEGSSMRMVKNDNWYGWNDGKHEGQFQTEEINTTIITNHNTALNEFMAGRLDDIDLTVNDMGTYGSSKRKMTTPESYTQKISFNSSWTKLKARQGINENKTILSNKDFRKGLSLYINREDFVKNATSGSSAFTGLLNDLYLVNNATGDKYRDTEQGKGVYNAVYGELGGSELNINNGELTNKKTMAPDRYGNNDELAILYVAKAIKDELANTTEGSLSSGDQINLEFRVYDASSDNTKGAMSYLSSRWSDLIEKACEKLTDLGIANLTRSSGSKFKLTVQTDQDYYTSAQNGGYDMIFSIWGGSVIDPYNLMEVYCSKDFTKCAEYGFKGHQADADNTLTISYTDSSTGEEITANHTFDAWFNEMIDGDEFNEAQYGDDVKEDDDNYEAWYNAHNNKLNVLAGLEAGIINRWEAIPLASRGSSSLLGFKVEYATKSYVTLAGYGGLRFMTYNFTNEGWDSQVSQKGGNLSDSYK